MAKYLCIWVRAYWFSVTSFSKWLSGGHIRFFGFWMAWFQQRNSSLFWNFSFKFHVHVLCGCRQKPNDCQLWCFQKDCLLILNNVQLQSTHCPLPPSPMGRGYPSRSLIYNFQLSLPLGDCHLTVDDLHEHKSFDHWVIQKCVYLKFLKLTWKLCNRCNGIL